MVAHNMQGHILLNGWFVRGDPKYREYGCHDYIIAGISNLEILQECLPAARFVYNPLDDRKFANIQFCL